MKTITTKDAFKLLLFLLILFSAKAIAFTKLPNEESSRGSGSRFSTVSKSKTTSKTHSNGYASTYKGKAVNSMNNKRFKK
ncbi:hypothetical protein ACSVH2_02030 [Flavobacterium sp. RSB2_4_14]|uniref:hypothetical protein n=1 Tax=Flavobacterium sp. RSB2_4_14 TaxID=3447665 RepID=UPI003F409F72